MYSHDDVMMFIERRIIILEIFYTKYYEHNSPILQFGKYNAVGLLISQI